VTFSAFFCVCGYSPFHYVWLRLRFPAFTFVAFDVCSLLWLAPRGRYAFNPDILPDVDYVTLVPGRFSTRPDVVFRYPRLYVWLLRFSRCCPGYGHTFSSLVYPNVCWLFPVPILLIAPPYCYIPYAIPDTLRYVFHGPGWIHTHRLIRSVFFFFFFF